MNLFACFLSNFFSLNPFLPHPPPCPHFFCFPVSESFKDAPLISRHRAVNKALASFMGNGGVRDALRPHLRSLSFSPQRRLPLLPHRWQVHALAITALTPQQWTDRAGAVGSSPACMGGMKSEQRATAGKQQEGEQ
jgi:stress-induced morphogen